MARNVLNAAVEINAVVMDYLNGFTNKISNIS